MSWNINAAIKAYSDKADVTITWEPFILNRSIPASGMSLRSYLTQVYGDASGYDASHNRLVSVGLQCDPPVRFWNGERTLFPTIDAHRLVEFAKRADFAKHNRLMENLFKYHFELGKNVNDFEMLIDAAMEAGYADAGCTRDGLMAFLRSNDLRDATLERESQLKRRYREASGAPFFIIEGFGLTDEPVRKLSGAQPTPLFSKVFRDLVAAHERVVAADRAKAEVTAAIKPASAPVNTATDAVCAVCGKESKSKCSRCKTRRYCSPECQKRDWPTHKSGCTAAPATSSGDACEGGVCAL